MKPGASRVASKKGDTGSKNVMYSAFSNPEMGRKERKWLNRFLSLF
jgi:hypothetical protein